jgi:hypothetical protein
MDLAPALVIIALSQTDFGGDVRGLVFVQSSSLLFNSGTGYKGRPIN